MTHPSHSGSFTSDEFMKNWTFLKIFLHQTSGELKGWEQTVHFDSLTRRPIKSHQCSWRLRGTDRLTRSLQNTVLKWKWTSSIKANLLFSHIISFWCLERSLVGIFAIKAAIYIWYLALLSFILTSVNVFFHFTSHSSEFAWTCCMLCIHLEQRHQGHSQCSKIWSNKTDLYSWDKMKESSLVAVSQHIMAVGLCCIQ